ncbi:MAG: ABC transporter ATP-binding protein [Candidatus Eremiobacteraeota bacterium]|nr:ABC transporter ATP-binding protein [Candidatus Eremiobacteraeota bacterium]
MLELRDVEKRFGGLQAVKGVSLSVEAGDLVALIGPNGAGKTTLFSCVAGYHRISGGSIAFDGRSIENRQPFAICRSGIARTFQVVKPFAGMTVLQSVMVGSFLHERHAHAARRAALEVLERLHITHLQDVEARHLTLVLKKRLEVARALATRPRLLLLDEVMAGLNPGEIPEILAAIRHVNEAGVTILFVEHNMAAVMSIAKRVVVLHHGELLADGSPQAVARDPKVVSAYLGDEYSIA